jgi:hypothetical protein
MLFRVLRMCIDAHALLGNWVQINFDSFLLLDLAVYPSRHCAQSPTPPSSFEMSWGLGADAMGALSLQVDDLIDVEA